MERMIPESEALAMVAAENEACATIRYVEAQYVYSGPAYDAAGNNQHRKCELVEQEFSLSGTQQAAIRSRLTAPQVAALERVKAEARAEAERFKDELIASWIRRHQESGHALAEAEAEAKRLREALKRYGIHDVECPARRALPCNCGFSTALSAPAVGAAKGDRDGR